jgi:hypothetical protein
MTPALRPKGEQTLEQFDPERHRLKVAALNYGINEGREYRGCRVNQCSVIYSALEGESGLPRRIEALRQHYTEICPEIPIDKALFHLIDSPLNLRLQAGRLIIFLREYLKLPPGIGLVVIDTLNRSLVGSESRDEDMAAYLGAVKAIEDAFGCFVLLVHHCGHDESRPRGHTSLTAAVDVQLAAEKLSDGAMVVRVERAKDAVGGR